MPTQPPEIDVEANYETQAAKRYQVATIMSVIAFAVCCFGLTFLTISLTE